MSKMTAARFFSINSLPGDLGFWVIWMIILAVNAFLAPALLLGLSFLLQSDILTAFYFAIGKGPNSFFLIIGIVTGLLAGLLQWLVLRRRINQAGGWIWATLTGAVIGWVMVSIISIPGDWDDGFTLFFYPVAISGIFSSIAQWFVIRQEVKHSYLWILSSILVWSCVLFVGEFSKFAGLYNFILPGAIFGCMLIATAVVFLFSRREQYNFNSIILGGISLLFVIGWGISARITYKQLNQQIISFQLQNVQFGQMESVAFSPDGTRIAGSFTSMSSAEGDTITAWEITSGKNLFSIPSKTGFYQICFSPDGSILASIDRNSKVALWDANSGVLIRRVPIFSGRPKNLAFSLDNQILIISNKSADGTMTLWDIQNNKVFRRLHGSGEINSIAMNPAGELLVARAETIEVWDIASGKIIREIPKVNPSSNSNALYAFSPDGKYLLETGNIISKQVREAFIWDLKRGELLQKLETGTIMAAAFSPDGNILAIGGTSKEGIRLLDTSTWKEIKTLLGGGMVSSLVFSADSSLLAAGSWRGGIEIFEVR